MKRRLAAFAVAASAFGAVPAVLPATDRAVLGPAVADAKPCSFPWKHATLSWGHKCLIKGQNCKPSGDREYHRYGFHCHGGRLR